MALGCQAEALGEAGLWWSPGVRGGGADCCPLLHRVSPGSLTFVSHPCWQTCHPMLSLHRRQTPEEWRIGLGAGPEERGLKKLILHGAYTHLEGGYDVALLLLAQPMTLGPSLQPLCLPYADHYLPDGEHGWILGLAQGADTSFPQTVPVTLLEPRACSRLHATLESDGIPILPGMVCTSVVGEPPHCEQSGSQRARASTQPLATSATCSCLGVIESHPVSPKPWQGLSGAPLVYKPSPPMRTGSAAWTGSSILQRSQSPRLEAAWPT
nr:polyserase-2 isoform X5 [Manis javanica]XP_036875304.1 polyserase-2-like isoform X4 [Manis javanica]